MGDKFLRKMALGIFLCIFSLPLSALVLQTAYQDSDPFKFDPKDTLHKGFCAELINLVQKELPELEFKINSTPHPLPRIEQELKTGELDIFFCLIKSPEREKIMNFIPVTLYKTKHALVTRKNDPLNIQSYEELKSLSKKDVVLVQQHSALVSHLRSLGVSVDDGTKDYILMLRKIMSGRGRILYAQEGAINKFVNRAGLQDKIHVSPVFLKEEDQYVAYSKNISSKNIEKIEQVLIKFKKNGTLKKLYEASYEK